MPPGIGYSFQPGSQDTPLEQRGQNGQGVAPQHAIRTLSLRIPQTTSVPGIAPLPLLNARGGGGSDLDMLLMALLKAFSGTGGGQPGTQSFQVPGLQSGGGGTPPRVTPIDPTDPAARPPREPAALPFPTKPFPRDFPTDGQREPAATPDAGFLDRLKGTGFKAPFPGVEPLF